MKTQTLRCDSVSHPLRPTDNKERNETHESLCLDLYYTVKHHLLLNANIKKYCAFVFTIVNCSHISINGTIVNNTVVVQ